MRDNSGDGKASLEKRKASGSIVQEIVKLVNAWARPWQSLARSLHLQKLPRRKLGAVTLVLFALATGLAIRQYLQPFEWHASYRLFTTRQWWSQPLEWNIDSQLTQIKGNINVVRATRNGECLWIAGDAGLLAYSNNLGKSWTQFAYDRTNGEFRAPGGARPCGATTASAVSESWFSPPSVYAASGQIKMPQQGQQSNPSQSPSQQTQTSPQGTAPNGQGTPKDNLGTSTNEGKTSAAQESPIGSVPVRGKPANGNVEMPQQGQQSNPSQSPSQQTQTSPQGGAPNGQGTPTDDLTSTNEGKTKVPKESPIGSVPVRGKPANGNVVSKNTSGAAGNSNTTNNNKPPSAPPDFSKPPDLWGTTIQGIPPDEIAGVMYASDGDYYGSSDPANLSWQRLGTQDYKRYPDVYVSDKLLNFAMDSSTGSYRLNSVGGASFLRGGPGMIWSGGSLHLNAQGQKYTELPTSKPAGDITSLSLVDQNSGWAINFSSGSEAPESESSWNSQVLHTLDGGKIWSVSMSFSGERLKSVYFAGNGKRGWVAGDHGALLYTTDGGQNWFPLTASAGWLLHQGKWTSEKQFDDYVRFLPPWYLVVVLICGLLATPVLFPVDDSNSDEQQEGHGEKVQSSQTTLAGDKEADASAIGNQAIADKPLEPGDIDALGLSTIAAGLAFFIRNEKTKPPLAIAVNGRWGSGKSSLMNLLRGNLEAWGAHPVWFNAWHHQKEDQMLAALLQAVKSQAVPPLWQFSGLSFRAKLAWKRLQRSWFKLVLLAGAVFLTYKVGLFVQSAFGVSVLSLLNLLFSGKDGSAASSKLAGKPLFTMLAAAGAIYRVISDGLTAFGSNPASLLASVSGGTKTKDLDAQTSFRQRFATEFNDVTRSLGQNQRMLILIDDLDRCRPEKVREILEGVNFLASSGDCFIVLGMARDIVEHCVGLSFAAVVDTMEWSAMGLTPDDIADALQRVRSVEESRRHSSDPAALDTFRNTSNLESRAKRHAFAHLYLDKLIQIEVSIPEPTALQRQMLFRSKEELKDVGDANERLVQTMISRSRKLYTAGQPITAAALAAVALFGMWTLSLPTVHRLASQWATSTESAPAAPQNPANGNPVGQQSNPTGKPQPVPTATAAPSITGIFPYGSDSAQHESPIISKGNTWSKGWEEGWPFYLIALGTISLIATSLRRLPQRIVRDEATFTNALTVWHPLVMTGGARNTPRTARRFQNRVRYLAMRQRALLRGKAMSLGERWLRQFLGTPQPRQDFPVHLPESEDIAADLAIDAEGIRRLLETGQSGQSGSWTITVTADSVTLSPITDVGMDEDQFKALVLANIYIPEPVLVALTAIEEYEPSWIQEGDQFRAKVVQSFSESGDTKADLLAKTIKEHIRIWNNWYNLEQYRRAYMRLCSEVNRLDHPQVQTVAMPNSVTSS